MFDLGYFPTCATCRKVKIISKSTVVSCDKHLSWCVLQASAHKDETFSECLRAVHKFFAVTQVEDKIYTSCTINSSNCMIAGPREPSKVQEVLQTNEQGSSYINHLPHGSYET